MKYARSRVDSCIREELGEPKGKLSWLFSKSSFAERELPDSALRRLEGSLGEAI